MKKLLPSLCILLVFAGCISRKTYTKIDKDPHPSYVHHMELILAHDVNSDDSATALWANDFMKTFEKSFRAYQPDLKLIKKLKKYTDSISVKVIGGNWCSDTRREVPRLCKVLQYMAVPVEKMSYYRVNREKKAIEQDFASTYKFSFVPTIVIYKNGTECGKITENPQKTLEADILAMLIKK